MADLVLVTGGVRSGKSAYACRRAAELGARGLFVATCRPQDDAMRARIARHRAERPPSWQTREVTRDLHRALDPSFDAAVVDCLTLFVSRLLWRGASDADVLDQVTRLVEAPPLPLFVVTNEVGSGVHPLGELSLRFVDVLGFANQRIASRAHEVVLMVSGVPVPVKGAARAGGPPPEAGGPPADATT